jgi:Trypsin-co-occurring domain 1
VPGLIRIPLGGGGWFLVEGEARGEPGPVQAGRVRELVSESAQTLEELLEPVVEASRTLLEGLRKASPDGVEVAFGVELTAETGAVITKVGGGCHLTVKLVWTKSESDIAE